MPTQITEWSEALMTSLAAAMALLFSAIPKIIGFVLIVVAGWFIASLIDKGLAAVLRAIRFNDLAQRAGLADFIRSIAFGQSIRESPHLGFQAINHGMGALDSPFLLVLLRAHPNRKKHCIDSALTPASEVHLADPCLLVEVLASHGAFDGLSFSVLTAFGGHRPCRLKPHTLGFGSDVLQRDAEELLASVDLVHLAAHERLLESVL